jgi:predicted RNase H-like nuclease
MRSVLGIDAAWTEREPSGVALVADDGSGWSLVEAAASYAGFLETDPIARHRGSVPDAGVLIAAAAIKAGATVDLVAIDMPLSLAPIVGRRASDNLISSEYGARHSSTHTPSATRPGRLSDELRVAFDVEGYPLAVSGQPTRAILEVYPHPALIELAAADRRLPYKQSKSRKYWPDESTAARRANLIRTWGEIVDLLDVEIRGVKKALPLPSTEARSYELKAFEDTLDAVVCAWVGACAMDGRARAFGDELSAIWVPVVS